MARRWTKRFLMMAALLVWVAPLAATVSPPVAFAQKKPKKPSKKDRKKALNLGGEALDLFDAGDYDAALEKFIEADGIVPAPTLKLHIARCLDKLDRMKEAADMYRAVISTELTSSSPQVHRDARKKAVPELAKVLEDTPTAVVVVKGSGAADATVTMDGEELPIERIGEKQSLDPGHYRFEAMVGERRAVRELDLERGQNERIVLHIEGDDVEVDPDGGDEGDGSIMRIAGWSAVAVGGAALSVGSILGVVVLSEEDELLANCVDRKCPPEFHDDADAFDGKRVGSTVSLIIGGVVAAAGLTIVLLAPGSDDSDDGEDDGGDEGADEIMWSPLIGPGYLGVGGRF